VLTTWHRWRAPLGWALLLAVGQGATLAMIHAGPRVGYQHYIVPWHLASEAPLALIAFALEALAVGLGLAVTPRARSVLRGVRGWQLAFVASVFVLTSATLSLKAAVFGAELVFASLVQFVHLGAVLLFALSLQAIQVDRAAGLVNRVLGDAAGTVAEPGRPDRFAWILAGAVTAISTLLVLLSYQRHPHVPDEVVYLLQSRYLAKGMLALPLPPVHAAFDVDLMMYQAHRWFSPVNPGWPFLLATATALGITWFFNPLLGGLNILLAYVVLRELYPRRTARIAILLLAVSPWQLFMSMNLMTHTATLTAALVAAAAVGRLRRDWRLRWAVIGGIGIGVIGLIRPLEAVPVALLLGFWSLGATGAGRWRLPSVVLTLAALATSLLVLPYNKYYTGSAREFPIMAYNDATYGPGRNDLGFGPNRGLPFGGLDPLPGHGPLDVLINANFNFFQTNVELFGWATGSLLIVALLLAQRRMRRPDWYMIAVVAGIVGIHSFYYFSGGPDFGARYWYLIVVPCVALAARGIDELAGRAENARRVDGPRVFAGVGLLICISLLEFVPWRAVDKYHHYRGMRPEVREFVNDTRTRGSIVLIRGRRHPDFASAFVYNPLDLMASTTIFAWDRGPEARRDLVAAYPGRTFCVVEGPTVTGDGYRLIAGPMRGDELLARRDSVIPWP
jgi:hypothetical protein